jgi:hypothetical protein
LTQTQYDNITIAANSTEEVCSFLDIMGGTTMLNAKKDMQDKRQTYFDDLKKLDEKIQNEWGTADKISNMDNTLGKEIQTQMKQLGDDNVTFNKLIDLRDTLIGQEETSGLTNNSNQMQFGIWLLIGIGMLLYTLFGINSDKLLSGKNLVMLIICVIILFVLIRRLYLTKRF